MQRREFTINDQLFFAELSGDYNPVHIDEIAARRLVFGRTIMHGIHSLLWGLDTLFKNTPEPIDLKAVRVDFQKEVGVGETLSYAISERADHRAVLKLESGGRVVALISVEWVDGHGAYPDLIAARVNKNEVCREVSIDEVANQKGAIDLYLDEDLAGSLFPDLVRVLPHSTIAILLATSRIVGMHCPGLHSLFSALDLCFTASQFAENKLAYNVKSYNSTFAMLIMALTGPGVKGEIKSFFRPSPVQQEYMGQLKSQVLSGEFSGQQAYIVGGSRGLGEVAAKLLGAGGAEVVITYHRGAEDAAKIVEDIQLNGGSASCMRFDVLNPEAVGEKITNQSEDPPFIYYFATPHIALTPPKQFNHSIFQNFADYYIKGFLNTLDFFHQSGLLPVKVLVPSSIYVDKTPDGMGEYAAAKAACESMCLILNKMNSSITIHTPRLPKLQTDQTASLLPFKVPSPVPILIKCLRDLRDS